MCYPSHHSRARLNKNFTLHSRLCKMHSSASEFYSFDVQLAFCVLARPVDMHCGIKRPMQLLTSSSTFVWLHFFRRQNGLEMLRLCVHGAEEGRLLQQIVIVARANAKVANTKCVLSSGRVYTSSLFFLCASPFIPRPKTFLVFPTINFQILVLFVTQYPDI